MALTLSKKKPQTFKAFVEKQEINLITRVDGIWKMILSQFKNVRQRGVDTTELTAFAWWIELFQLYQKNRPLLLGKQHKHDFVFVARQGTPFTANYFSDFLSTLLHRHTGQRVATNILRSSFVTHFYGTDDAQNPAIRESVASVMRHTVDQALRVYDRRSSAAKKHKGLQLLASKQDIGLAAATAIVVLFQRVPHQIIQEDGPRLLLGKMTLANLQYAALLSAAGDRVSVASTHRVRRHERRMAGGRRLSSCDKSKIKRAVTLHPQKTSARESTQH
jgi:hypothetical protein